MSFDTSWEKQKYSKIKQLDSFPYEKGNRYPYDLLVTIVARSFFKVPKKERGKIRMLDLGCGTGNNAQFLAENGFDVYGIDCSGSAVEICKEKFSKMRLKGNFIAGDFLELPYKDDFFDLAIDRESLYANKLSDIKKSIKQVYKKLKKGGLFVSFMYSSNHPDKKFGKEVEPNTFSNFSKESTFHERGVAHFAPLNEILRIYSDFNIESVMRHSFVRVHGNPSDSMELDEFVIICEK